MVSYLNPATRDVFDISFDELEFMSRICKSTLALLQFHIVLNFPIKQPDRNKP